MGRDDDAIKACKQRMKEHWHCDGPVPDEQKPELTAKDNTLGDEYSHPAFAVMRASRQQGGSNVLFDSNIKHNNLISVEIDTAVLSQSTGYHFIHGREKMIRLVMSESQWGHFVSSLNMGSGTPVTLEWVGNDRVPKIIPTNVVDKFKEQFTAMGTKRLDDVRKGIANIKELIKNKKISKKVGESLLNDFGSSIAHVEANNQHMEDCFAKTIEKTVQEGKADLESHAVVMAEKLGISRIQLAGGTPPTLLMDNSSSIDNKED